jgi:hypothetical protein
MRPLDGTTWAGLKRVRHSNLLPARNDRRAGEIASLTPATAACTVPFERLVGWGVFGFEKECLWRVGLTRRHRWR